MMLQDEPLDYEALVEEYNKNLFLVLRGHRSAEYLDTWVPDENPFKGVLNMIEAAELTGTAEIAIRLGAATLKTLDLAALEAAAALIGTVSVERGAGEAILRVTDISGAPIAVPHTAIAAPYQAAVAAAAVDPKHGSELSGGAHGDIFETTVDGVTLTIRLHAGSFIAEAAHHGAASLATTAVLDVFCEELSGLTVQEAAEHGVVRLEYRMRANARQRPVPGIVLPRNADKMFDLPARLIRSLAAVYREKTGKAFGENNFTRRVDSAWLHLSDEEKVARASAVLAERIKGLGLLDDDVRVIAVEQQVRLTIAFRESVEVQKKPRFIRDFEHVLHETLEPSLQVFMSEVKDANVLRRL
jgi:NifU-like protein involved in Fe-S cluster formation